jgi:hypothetical protein
VVDQLPEDAERAALERGAEVDRAAHGIRLLVDAARKRDVIEALWIAGCDVVRMNPVKDSLEDVFLNLVGGRS